MGLASLGLESGIFYNFLYSMILLSVILGLYFLGLALSWPRRGRRGPRRAQRPSPLAQAELVHRLVLGAPLRPLLPDGPMLWLAAAGLQIGCAAATPANAGRARPPRLNEGWSL